MDVLEEIKETMKILNDIDFKSSSRKIRMKVSSYKQMVSLGFSKELRDALKEKGLDKNSIDTGQATLLLSDNTVPGQGPYRITFFDSSDFSPIGHFAFSTAQEAVANFILMSNFLLKNLDSSEKANNLYPPIEGEDSPNISTRIVAFNNKEKQILISKLRNILIN